MWWVFGSLAVVLYIALLISLGVTTLRNGHTFLFIAGIFLPLLWIIGAVMRPTAKAARHPV